MNSNIENWRKTTLGELCFIRRGSSPRPIKNYLTNDSVSGMPWVKIADATETDSRYIDHTSEFIIQEGVKKSVIVRPGDLILSNSGTAGLPKFMRITACIHDGWQTFKNLKGIDKDYLYYYLLYIRSRLLFNANESTMTNLTLDMLREYEIMLPPIETQKKIVHVLSTVDRKIEINAGMIDNLENQALLLFKEWFINYAPFDGRKPCEWVEGKFGDFVTVKRGGSPRPIQDYLSDSGLRWLKISDVTDLRTPFITQIKEHIKESGLSKTVLLSSGSIVLSNSATPGVPIILDVDSCIHDGWLYFPESLFSNEYLYLFFKLNRKKLVSLGNGSVFTNLKTDILKGFDTVLPERKVLIEFDKKIVPMFDGMRHYTRENDQLRVLRNSLIVRLMSGKISAEDVRI